MDSTPRPELGFDVFISYSRKDAAFARLLEQALRGYRPPKDLAVPQRNLRVFRDEADFTGAEYHASLDRCLKDSAALLVICSPHSSASEYVGDEIRRFAAHRGKEHIVPILLDGLPNNETADERDGRRAFPATLVEVLPMPLAADYRGFDVKRDRVRKGAFASAWFKTLADIYADYGVDRAKVEGRERRREVRRLRIVAAVSGSVAMALAALTVWALISRNEARRQRDAAQARENEAQARLAFDASSDGLVKATLHAVESVRATQTVDGQISLMRFLAILPHPPVWTLGGPPRAKPPSIDGRRRGLALSRDGTRLASVGGTGPVRVVDARSGQPIAEFAVNRRPADRTVAAFSPDAARLVLGCGHQACVIDATSGALVARLPEQGAHGRMVWSASFSPDGRQLAIASYGTDEIRVYDTERWTPAATLRAGAGTGFSVAFSEDGRWLATTGGSIRLWRTGEYQSPAAEERVSGIVWSIAFTRDSAALITAGNQVQTWAISDGKVPTGAVALKGEGAAPIRAHTVRPVMWHGRECIAAATPAAAYILCDRERLTEVMRVPLSSEIVATSGDGRTFVNETEEGTLAQWPLHAGLAALRVAIGAPVESLVHPPGADWLAAASGKGDVAVLDAGTWKERRRVRLSEPARQIIASADRRWLIARSTKVIQPIDTSTWNVGTAYAFDDEVSGLAFDALDRSLFIVSGSTFVVVQPGEWREHFRVKHDGRVRTVRVHRDGRRAATVTHWSAGHDEGVLLTRVFDLPSGREVAWEFAAGRGSISQAFLKEELERQKRALAGGDAQLLKNSENWQTLDLEHRGDRPSAGGWSAQLSRTSMRLEDTATGRAIAELQQESEISEAVFVPSDSPRWLASGGSDGTIAIWPILSADLADEACARLRGTIGAAALAASIKARQTFRSCPSK